MPFGTPAPDPTPQQNFFKAAPDGAIYSDFKMAVSYGHHDGRVAVPIAGDLDPMAASVEIVQVCRPIDTKVVNWTAEREGSPPQVPSPTDIDGNSVLLSRTITPAVPVPLLNGLGFAWRISGTYTYVLQRPIDLAQGLPTGTMPVITKTADEQAFPGANFITGLVGKQAGDQRNG